MSNFDEFYSFDKKYVKSAFEYIVDLGFVVGYSVNDLLAKYENKSLHTLKGAVAHHVLIALEGIEDELDGQQEFSQTIAECTCTINSENDVFPACIGYPQETGRGHIYIVRPGCLFEREYTKTTVWLEEDEPVFKVGRTRNIFSRMSYYPPMTKLVFCIEVPKDIVLFERRVLDALQNCEMFKRRTRKIGGRDDDVFSGNEVFVGNDLDAIPVIMELHKQMFPFLYQKVCLDEHRYLWEKEPEQIKKPKKSCATRKQV